MAGNPFPVDPVLTGIVVNYQNAELIADRVLPRLAPALPRKLFKYMKFDFAQGITVPDTKVGRKGTPNEVEFGGTEVPGETFDHGLDDVIPQDDIANAPAGYDPRAFAAQYLMNLVLLGREIRVSGVVFNAATYPSGNKETLSGSDQWSHADGDPIADIEDAMDTMIMRPNVMVLGRATWTKMRRNKKLVSALSASGTDSGMASRQAVAELFELEEIVIGSSWVNTAKPGQAPVRARTWGKHAALIRRESINSSIGQVPTFGWTAQHGTRVAGSIPEPKTGLRGAERVRSGESVAEVISAPDLGYLFTNAVA